MDSHTHGTCRRFCCSDKLEIVLQPFDGWHEDAKTAIPRFDGNGGADRAAKLAEHLLDALLLRFRCRE